MFEHIKSFPIEGFQKINAKINDDGLVQILEPDNGRYYDIGYILDTKYITKIEAVNCIRDIYKYCPDIILPMFGFPYAICYETIISGHIDDACDLIYGIQFHYQNLNDYVYEAQLIYHNRKRGFQCPDEIRRSVTLIGMAYIELAGGPQMEFIQPTKEEILWKQRAVEEYQFLEYTAVGICRMVWDWRREGKTEQEIAELLYDDGKWCSLAQIGALLYPEQTRVSADSMKKYAARLLGKAK